MAILSGTKPPIPDDPDMWIKANPGFKIDYTVFGNRHFGRSAAIAVIDEWVQPKSLNIDDDFQTYNNACANHHGGKDNTMTYMETNNTMTYMETNNTLTEEQKFGYMMATLHTKGFSTDYVIRLIQQFAKTDLIPCITRVISSGPVTTVLWSDKKKTQVRIQDNEDNFDSEKAVAMCIAKRFLEPSGMYDLLPVAAMLEHEYGDFNYAVPNKSQLRKDKKLLESIPPEKKPGRYQPNGHLATVGELIGLLGEVLDG